MRRIVHYYQDLTRPSGVTAAILGWQRAQIESGWQTMALHSGAEADWPLPNRKVPHVGKGRQLSMPLLRGFLEPGDVLILHEGWVSSNIVAGMEARILDIPYVCVPHGVYEPQILKHLKAPYQIRRLFESYLLRNAMAVHVFYDSEADYVRSLAPQQKTFTLATGLEQCEDRWVGGGGYLAWFGRYSLEHKGLDRLLASYALVPVRCRLPLRLRGIDYLGGKAEVYDLVRALNLSEWVSVGDKVTGAAKVDFLVKSEGFIFPSRWESQGIALMEAISLGVPTLVSASIHAASSLGDNGAAKVVDFSNFMNASSDIENIREIFSLSDSAIAYARKILDWKEIGMNYSAVMDELAGSWS